MPTRIPHLHLGTRKAPPNSGRDRPARAEHATFHPQDGHARQENMTVINIHITSSYQLSKQDRGSTYLRLKVILRGPYPPERSVDPYKSRSYNAAR